MVTGNVVRLRRAGLSAIEAAVRGTGEVAVPIASSTITAILAFRITGAVVLLLVTGYTFSFTAFDGLTSLVWIVVNNSIILVDNANRLRDDGASVLEAVREAGRARFVPIVLTTLTTTWGCCR